MYEYVHQHDRWWDLNDWSPWHWLGKGANSVRTRGTRCVYRAISHTWVIRRTMTVGYSRYTWCRDVTEWRGECAEWRTSRHIARVLPPHRLRSFRSPGLHAIDTNSKSAMNDRRRGAALLSMPPRCRFRGDGNRRIRIACKSNPIVYTISNIWLKYNTLRPYYQLWECSNSSENSTIIQSLFININRLN